MSLFGPGRLCRSAACRLITGVALVSFLISTVGLPLPALSRKDASQPFPCQNHPCGCRSAEECWRHCCCFTAAERWAWARANQVEPPSYAELPDAEDPGHSHCCAAHEAKGAHAGHKSQESMRGSQASPRWLLAVANQRCQGVASQWLGIGAAVPPPPMATWSPAWPLIEKLSYGDRSSSSLALNPPDPPPRSAS